VKKRFMFLVLGLIVSAFALFFMWPLSFSVMFDDISDNARIYVVVNETGVKFEGGVEVPRGEVTEHIITSDSQKFQQIQQILDNFSYRRTFRTFFSDASMMGDDAGFWLSIYVIRENDTRSIITGGTREILVNSRVYRVGYWGNRANIEMMNEIRSLLES